MVTVRWVAAAQMFAVLLAVILTTESRAATASSSTPAHAIPYKVTFPKRLGGDARLTYAAGDHLVRFALEGARGRVVRRGGTAKVTSARPGLDLEYLRTPKALKESVVLRSPAASKALRYDLEVSPGLRPVLRADRSIRFLEGRRTVFWMPAPFMIDSDTGGANLSTAVKLGLRRSAAKRYVLTIQPDRDWLKSRERKWPVIIDPTLTTSSPRFALDPSSVWTTVTGCPFGQAKIKQGHDYLQCVQVLPPVTPLPGLPPVPAVPPVPAAPTSPNVQTEKGCLMPNTHRLPVGVPGNPNDCVSDPPTVEACGGSLFAPCDRDKDGVPDEQDECPLTPGGAATQGCPDSDGDGVGDQRDACPDQPGSAALAGCPDDDSDGVRDSVDACPQEHGQGASNGCPPPPPPPPGEPDDPPGSGPPDTAGEAPTYADEPPGDDDMADDTGYSSAGSLNCPGTDPYIFAVRDDDIGLGVLNGSATPEAAVIGFLAVGKMLPPISTAEFAQDSQSTTSRRFSVVSGSDRLAAIIVTQSAQGGWQVEDFAACGSFLDLHVPQTSSTHRKR